MRKGENVERFESVAGLVEASRAHGVKISSYTIACQAEELGVGEEELVARMATRLDIMEEAARRGSDPDLRSASGLSGGGAALLLHQADHGESLLGRLFGHAVARAVAVAECNASMGRIVAAPTAGSCGILPAAILTVLESGRADRDACVRSLFTASAVGMVIARNACLAGAQGGCQAECGSAAAMAAASVIELLGGTPEQVSAAVSIAVQNVLGLVCDPVAGLVECPCIMRNASGVVNALTAAEIACSGMCEVIPADEAIAAMKEVGDMMPACLRETAQGGLAVTPTAKSIKERLFGSEGQ